MCPDEIGLTWDEYRHNRPRFNTLRPKQNGRHFADDIFKRILLNANVRIFNQISLKLVPMSPVNNKSALVQIMAWRRPGDKPLSERKMVYLIDAYMRYSASMSFNYSHPRLRCINVVPDKARI